MTKTNEIKISVRNLVEFILRSGNLDSRFMGPSRALDGTKAHQKVQKQYGEGYTSEVTLSHSFEYEGFSFVIDGRADGIFTEGDTVIIDEIKSTTKPLELIDQNYNPIHWAQAKCYGYMYGIEKNLNTIGVQLTYFHLDSEETKSMVYDFTIEELREFFFDLISKYIKWATLTSEWVVQRNNSIKALEFPFEDYRRGQRKMAVAVYKTIQENKKIFTQAPTGIGKTVSTIFPAVKAMGEGHVSKIFYLTAKTITRQVAEETFYRVKEKGLRIKTITLTAKDKICFEKEAACNPDQCKYAKGHFDRVNDGILDILKNEDIITREIVEEYAKRYNICPFELSLDLALWVDCIICDYNYVFDPRVYLKRFFMDNGNDYTFLIDEAHNLVDRARDMFSAELNKVRFLELKKTMKEQNPKISKILGKLNSFMLSMKKKCEDNDFYIEKEESNDIYPLLRRLISESEEWLTKNENSKGYDELLELYFDSLAFLRIAELYDERFVSYVDKNRNDVRIKLFCLDPSYLLSEAVKRGSSAIFFSATLTPIDYFREILGGNEEDYTMILPSPFDRKNLCLLIERNISTRYKDRENGYMEIARYIKEVVEKKKGNYMVFFPSYKYMKEVLYRFQEEYPHINTIVQSSSMDEKEREDFLDEFKPKDEILVGFVVLGGIFSEGIDLKGDRLLGAIVVGVGLPQICLERNIIKEYYQRKSNSGFEYSYMFPGMNKVLQGAGRVIRSLDDRGVVFLIDERFSYSSYRRLFPKEWSYNIDVRTPEELSLYLDRFWNDTG